MSVPTSDNWSYQSAFWEPENNGGAPANCARLLLDNCLERCTITSTADATGLPNVNPALPPENLLSRNTYEYWQPSTWSPNVVFMLDGDPETIDCFIIARHNLGSAGLGGRFEVMRTGQATWSTVVNLTFKNDGPQMVAFRPTSVIGVRLRVFSGNWPNAAVFMTGKAVTMERPLRASMQPVALSRQTEVTPQISNAGQLLGQVKVRKGVSVSPEWNHLSGGFYRSTLKPLARALPGTPFGFLWSPSYAPDESVYGVVAGDPRGSHIRAVDRYTFGFNMQGVVPVP